MLDTYYYAKTGATFTGKTIPAGGTPSEWLRQEARYYRALGDDETADKWEEQARREEAYEKYPLLTRKCAGCGLVFDTFRDDDMDEWENGHDCQYK